MNENMQMIVIVILFQSTIAAFSSASWLRQVIVSFLFDLHDRRLYRKSNFLKL